MAGVADAVAPWDSVVPVIVASEAVPFLAVAGTDLAAIVETDLSVSPLSEEMGMSPTALVVGLQCSVEETQSRMDDSETASFEPQTD